MDRTSRLFLLMVFLALAVGWAVSKFTPDFNTETILKSNDDNRYYPTSK